MPVAARRRLSDLLDDLWTKTSIEFYEDPEDALLKGLEAWHSIDLAACETSASQDSDR